MKKIFYILVSIAFIVLAIIFISKKNSIKLDNNTHKNLILATQKVKSNDKYDTIITPKDYDCKEDFHRYSNYQKRFNLYISTFYEIDEAIKTPNNDSIAILRPYYSTLGATNCLPNREYEWLLLAKKGNDEAKYKIYKQVLYSVGYHSVHSLSTYENGFIINVDMSGNNYFGSKIYVNSQYCIDSIHIESWGHHQYEKTYKYKNFSVGLTWEQPLQSSGTNNRIKTQNDYAYKLVKNINREAGNHVLVTFSWRWDHGFKSKSQDADVDNRDTDSGILK